MSATIKLTRQARGTGETVNFRCHPAMVWPRYVASIVVPNLAISVRREE